MFIGASVKRALGNNLFVLCKKIRRRKRRACLQLTAVTYRREVRVVPGQNKYLFALLRDTLEGLKRLNSFPELMGAHRQ